MEIVRRLLHSSPQHLVRCQNPIRDPGWPRMVDCIHLLNILSAARRIAAFAPRSCFLIAFISSTSCPLPVLVMSLQALGLDLHSSPQSWPTSLAFISSTSCPPTGRVTLLRLPPPLAFISSADSREPNQDAPACIHLLNISSTDSPCIHLLNILPAASPRDVPAGTGIGLAFISSILVNLACVHLLNHAYPVDTPESATLGRLYCTGSNLFLVTVEKKNISNTTIFGLFLGQPAASA